MNFKDLIKTTEGAVVLGGLVLTVLFGKMFAIGTGVAYTLLNLPNVWTKLKGWFKNGDTD